MHGPEKSDSVVVAGKPTNKAERSVAEPVEPRTGTKGNADQQSTRRAQDRVSVSQALERVRQAARQKKKERFTALLHHVAPAMLRTAFYALKRDAAPGIDGMTWEAYEADLDRRIEELHARVKSGAYRASPSRRSYIPKEDGSKRPLAVAALEDKIVQRAVSAVLSAIYEEDFLGFSYGFRLSLHPCVRLSFERVHDKQTDKDSSHGRARQSTRPPHYEEDRASAINVTHRRSLPVETDADRLRPRFDRRPESRPATRRADRSRMPKDFHRADVRCGCGSACLACALEFARSGDTLIVWKLDRLAWSMKQLIETMENLQVRGIGTTVNYHEAG